MADLFAGDERPVTYADKLACISRELSYRRRLYPRWIDQGKMKPEEADRELDVMRAIEADYQKCVDLERNAKAQAEGLRQ